MVFVGTGDYYLLSNGTIGLVIRHKALGTLKIFMRNFLVLVTVQKFGVIVTKSLFILQKRAIQTIHNAGYRDRRNSLFVRSETPKRADLVEFKIERITFKSNNNQLRKL